MPHAVKQERIGRLVELVQRRALERSRRFVGTTQEVLVEGPSRTDPARLRGRTRHNKTVNFAGLAQPGDLVDVEITAATSTTLAGEESLLSHVQQLTLVAIFGPTAVGKTEIAIELAHLLAERDERPGRGLGGCLSGLRGPRHPHREADHGAAGTSGAQA